MARKTKEEAEQTRQGILDAATEVFWAKGVNRTTLSDIASAAGVTRGAIYWHFAGKDEIFNAMCNRIAPQFEPSYQRMLDSARLNAAASLWRHCLESFSIITRHDDVAKVLGIIYLRCEYVDETGSLQADSRSWISEQHRRTLAMLECAAAQGQLQAGVTAQQAALSLQALRRGLVQLWLAAPDIMPLDAQAATLLSPLFCGIFRDRSWIAEAHAGGGLTL
ncbi:TetR family transcriptional regulator [Crenobacter intestini]|uniref:TetR family transcriptional regulator n=1 Tax=Crenobacter intestini TaxID=2563443 RepID=A0A4T0UZM3_9NEIS|nr:TetR family transcriptional regulator [Crenobacter intestini]TIC84674.1 TetR family transcriptional regulator [Crenobacter intestini]